MRAAVVIAAALCAGLLGALLLTRLLRTLLFDVSPADGTALLIVAVVLTVVAFGATLDAGATGGVDRSPDGARGASRGRRPPAFRLKPEATKL